MATQFADPVSTRPATPREPRRPRLGIDTAWNIAAIGCTAGLLGLVMTVGADARWLAAIGRSVVQHGIPHGIPYASAPTTGWVNSLVLAELAFHTLEGALGDRGLVLANLVAVAAGLGLLARDARRAGAAGVSTAGVVALVGLGALPTLAVARIQMFSLVLFPALVGLLRAEARQPSRRVWLVLPLLALWSNLHGAVLAGVAVLFGYLLLERGRREPWVAVWLAPAALLALCATPAGLSTVDYFRGLVSNVAAERGLGQWAPLGSGGLDWLLIVVTLVLGLRLVRRRPPIWEWGVLLGLAVLTVKASRDGVWLLFFLATPAAVASPGRRSWSKLIPLVAVVGVSTLLADIVRAPRRSGVSPAALDAALRLAHGAPILADGMPAEQVALAGGRIWVGNPLDAFSRRVQNEYVDWVTGYADGRAALGTPQVRVVLVTRGSDADALTRQDRRFAPVMADATAVVYVKRRAGDRAPIRSADRLDGR
jgi:hypothetical protein